MKRIKLQFRSETIRTLTPPTLSRVRGGEPQDTQIDEMCTTGGTGPSGPVPSANSCLTLCTGCTPHCWPPP